MAGARHRPLYLGIDFGTTVTVAAGLYPGEEPVLVRFGSEPWMPSAVHLTTTGEILVGRAAVDATAVDPAGGQLTPKSMVGSGLEVETLRGQPLPLVALIGHVIAAAHRAAVEQLGAPACVALTCPVAWAPAGAAAVKRPVLRAAAQLAGVGPEAVVLDEAEAAAHHVGGGSLPVEEDELFALYDLGGGTCDIAVLRRELGRLNAVALAEAEVGGEHFDWLLYEHVLGRMDPETAGPLRDADDADMRRCRVALAAEVRGAKEALGAADSVTIRVPAPCEVEVAVTAAELEALLAPDVDATAQELRTAIDRAIELQHDGGGVAAVHLVGGSSLLPMVPRVVEAVTGLPARRSVNPREAVALGAAQALEAWSEAGRPTRRRARGDELHARRVLACAAMGDRPVFLHVDASDASAVSRLDPVRGAADRSVAIAGTEPDALVAGDEVVAATSASTVQMWDAELRAVQLPAGGHLPGPVRALHASTLGVWIVFEAEDGALWLRTIVVPAAEDESETAVRDVAIVARPAGDSSHSGGAPGLVTAAHGQRLLVAVRTRGPAGSEQHVFLAAADGRLRKLTARQAGPWLLDWLPTALGTVELEGGLDADGSLAPVAARLGNVARLDLDPVARSTAVLIPSGGAAALAMGTHDGWEVHRFDPSARGGGTGNGTHLLHRQVGATVVRGRRPVGTAEGTWLVIADTDGGTAAVLLGLDGELAQARVPDGARVLCASGERLYVAAGDELRSVPITRRHQRARR